MRQGNLLAKFQVRQHMVQQAQQELYMWSRDASLRNSFVTKEPLSATELEVRKFEAPATSSGAVQ